MPKRSSDRDGRVQRHEMRGEGCHQRIDLGVTAGLLRDQNRVASQLDPCRPGIPKVCSVRCPQSAPCLLGVFAGLLLKEPSLQPHQKTLWLIGAGAAMIALGVLWGLQFPIVKNIWTSSYVLVCGGLSALLLGVFHQVIDAWERRSWATIFIWMGGSAITLYCINRTLRFKPLAHQV